MSTDDLKTLATRYGSDKWNSHWYAEHYERHLAPLRARPIRLLEIGIGGYEDPKAGGSSLRMWKEFFPQGRIVGLDLYNKKGVEEDRISTYEGDQADVKLLRRIADEAGPFDVIVDDGSHRSKDVVTTLEVLFEHGLESHGIYAVEDLQTSYWRAFGGKTRVQSGKTSMAYLKSLCDRINFREWHKPGYEPSYLELHVVGIHFYHNMAIIQKGRNDEESNLIKDNFAPIHLRSRLRGAIVERASHSLRAALVRSPYGERVLDLIRDARRRRG